MVAVLWLFALVCFLIVAYIVVNRARPAPGVFLMDDYVPIFGHLPLVMKNVERFWDLEREPQVAGHTGSYQLAMFGSPCYIFIQGEENVRYVMKENFDNYQLPDLRITTLQELFGNGIFGANGDRWRVQRKAASHIFSQRQMRENVSRIVVEHMEVGWEVLGKAAEEGKPVEMQRFFMMMIMDVFTKWSMGEDINSLATGDVPFSSAFDRSQVLLMSRFLDPFWKFKRALGVGNEKELAGHITVIHNFVDAIVRKNVDAYEANSEKASADVGSSLMGWYIREVRKKGEKVSHAELRDAMINFMIAGRDTTATLLSWLLFELCKCPEVEQRLAKDIQDAVPEDIDNDPDKHENYMQVVNDIPFLEAVIMEILRMHPAVPSDDREAINDDILPDGTPIPRGALVNFHPYLAGRNPEIWSDAEQFKPSRWLNADGTVKQVSEYVMPTFSAGPRVCLGRTLALTEAKLVACMLLKRFEFRLQAGFKVEYVTSLVKSMKHGIMCEVAARKRNLPCRA